MKRLVADGSAKLRGRSQDFIDVPLWGTSPTRPAFAATRSGRDQGKHCCLAKIAYQNTAIMHDDVPLALIAIRIPLASGCLRAGVGGGVRWLENQEPCVPLTTGRLYPVRLGVVGVCGQSARD